MRYWIIGWLMCMVLDAQAGDKLSFQVTVNGEEVPYRLFSFFVMPSEQLSLTTSVALEIQSTEVGITSRSDLRYVLRAPARPGAYQVYLQTDTEQMVLNILVLTPLSAKKGEYLNGYRIGDYPSRLLNNDPIYERPKGLFEVTAETENLLLTPHFKLSQFVCKQVGDFPKYLVVRERLLLKLEYLLAIVQSKGIEIDTFGFISGYRTPFYNKSIGNVPYSRHVWGGAADIFIDEDKDGRMDDLNHDGLIDERDVRYFYNLVEDEYDKLEYKKFIGGLGFYKKNSRHSGFIHVDVRGRKARW